MTNWTRGQPAEVYWASRAGHRGGYAYRLCKVTDAKFWEVTEDCFREGHLNFYGNLREWRLFVSKPDKQETSSGSILNCSMRNFPLTIGLRGI